MGHVRPLLLTGLASWDRERGGMLVGYGKVAWRRAPAAEAEGEAEAAKMSLARVGICPFMILMIPPLGHILIILPLGHSLGRSIMDRCGSSWMTDTAVQPGRYPRRRRRRLLQT